MGASEGGDSSESELEAELEDIEDTRGGGWLVADSGANMILLVYWGRDVDIGGQGGRASRR
jgi:hypothetical protein